MSDLGVCECPIYALAVDANNVLWHMANKTGIEPRFHSGKHAERVMEMVRERQEVERVEHAEREAAMDQGWDPSW